MHNNYIIMYDSIICMCVTRYNVHQEPMKKHQVFFMGSCVHACIINSAWWIMAKGTSSYIILYYIILYYITMQTQLFIDKWLRL